jgi:hypothetical protein
MSVDSAAAAGAGAAADSAARQSRDDAWWTGPLLAPSASTLPRGHFLIEPYVFDSVVYAREDADGGKTRVPHEYVSGSLTYVLYGLTDRLTVGAIPRFGINHVIDGEKSGGVGSRSRLRVRAGREHIGARRRIHGELGAQHVVRRGSSHRT